MRRKLAFVLVTVALLSLPFLVRPALAAISIQAGPSASQLLAKVKTCSSPSGKYATDDGERSTISICKAGKAYFWKADMDIDCDGIRTSNCNEHTDCCIKPGSVAAVIFKSKVVYAVFADEGPKNIIGEASYATAKALGINPDPSNGGTDSGVTYIVFPGKVPSPVESNTAIDRTGAAAADAFVRG